jgi:superfamily I DNA/RNA helicase
MKDNFEPSLSGFLAEVALYTDLQQYEDGDNCVVLMTIHSAKGLEFDTVFIAGAEDGIFPGREPSASRRRWRRNAASAMWRSQGRKNSST